MTELETINGTELDDAELDTATAGNLARDIMLAVGGAILAVTPGVNAVYATGVAVGNAVTGKHLGLF